MWGTFTRLATGGIEPRTKKNRFRAMSVRPPTPDGLKPKDLIGIPWRLAFALQSDGWWLRSEVIWNKPNAHPESVRDRLTKSHETVFLLSKSQNYYYDVEAVRGPNGRRLRSVWDVPNRTSEAMLQPPSYDADEFGVQVHVHHRQAR